MSHITTVTLQVKDLDALEEAALACGLTLQRGQATHRWYSGQNPCSHALRLADHQTSDYEVGLVGRKDGDGYDLTFDNWGTQGQRLERAAGKDMSRLRREYAAAAVTRKTKAKLARQGFNLQREDLAGNRIRLRYVRR